MDNINAIASAKVLMSDIAKGHPMYVIVRNRARNGMSRTLDFYMPFINKGRMYTLWMTPHVAEVLGKTLTKQQYMIVRGCGVDVAKLTVARFAGEVFGDAEYLVCDVL